MTDYRTVQLTPAEGALRDAEYYLADVLRSGRNEVSRAKRFVREARAAYEAERAAR